MATTIQGIPIDFPYKPYPSQLSMMNRIIQSLEKSQNCLVESPTGSGKSLALLCASLAWVSKKLEDAKQITPEDCCPDCDKNTKFDDDDEIAKLKGLHSLIDCETCDCHVYKRLGEQPKAKIPKIYFGTRTHKQITQLIREFRKTNYSHINMTILSSRGHTCINQKVKKSSNLAEHCQDAVKHGRCHYYNKRKKAENHSKLRKFGVKDAFDVEDLVHALSRAEICPYYVARDLIEESRIVFCPYNYLLDPIFREAISLDLSESIIILDEAHNIEDASREAGSFTITEEQLFLAFKDLEELVRTGIKLEHTEPLKAMVECIQRLMELTKSRLMREGKEELNRVWTGLEIVGLMKQIGLGPDRLNVVKNHFKIVCDTDGGGVELDDGDDEQTSRGTLRSHTVMMLKSLFTVLDYITKDNFRFRDDYKVALVQSTVFERGGNQTGESPAWLSKSKVQRREEISLNFWCLNSAVIFEELGRVSRCIVLTSGTLSPLNSFQCELGVPFPVRLEAGHVIASSQVFAATIGRGPQGGEMVATYKHVETFRFQDEVGNLILEACKIVPHGVLCFLPSYSMLDKLVQRWESTGLMESMQEHKRVMLEPRTSNQFEAWMRRYSQGIEASERGLPGENGVLLFAVCRGKVSEGMDFADNAARLVITIGIPYPNFMNTQVKLKREYNDLCRSQSSSSASASAAHPGQVNLLSGSEWYEVQAYRAINQALGRCIRHRKDWGGVLMVDARFTYNNCRSMDGISKWLRQQTVHYQSCQELFSSLTDFVKERKRADEEEEMVQQIENVENKKKMVSCHGDTGEENEFIKAPSTSSAQKTGRSSFGSSQSFLDKWGAKKPQTGQEWKEFWMNKTGSKSKNRPRKRLIVEYDMDVGEDNAEVIVVSDQEESVLSASSVNTLGVPQGTIDAPIQIETSIISDTSQDMFGPIDTPHVSAPAPPLTKPDSAKADDTDEEEKQSFIGKRRRMRKPRQRRDRKR